MKFANAHIDIEILPHPGRWPERLRTAQHMSGLWAGFARAGVPSALGVPKWPPFAIISMPDGTRFDGSAHMVTDGRALQSAIHSTPHYFHSLRDR